MTIELTRQMRNRFLHFAPLLTLGVVNSKAFLASPFPFPILHPSAWFTSKLYALFHILAKASLLPFSLFQSSTHQTNMHCSIFFFWKPPGRDELVEQQVALPPYLNPSSDARWDAELLLISPTQPCSVQVREFFRRMTQRSGSDRYLSSDFV